MSESRTPERGMWRQQQASFDHKSNWDVIPDRAAQNQRTRRDKKNGTIQQTIAAALHERRSRRGQRRDRIWVLSIPIARLLATFAGALDCTTLLHVPRFLSISPVGCTGPHLGLATPAHVRKRDEKGIGGRCHPGRDLVVARAWNIGPVLQALLAFHPVRHLSARWVRGGIVMISLLPRLKEPRLSAQRRKDNHDPGCGESGHDDESSELLDYGSCCLQSRGVYHPGSTSCKAVLNEVNITIKLRQRKNSSEKLPYPENQLAIITIQI
ncbi:hypothetical protein BDR04DRAFT_1121538 [Suillus decipiens]|nr:hypothetical protein BDR04DRAFT_1121538 [Suillus decipiens]